MNQCSDLPTSGKFANPAILLLHKLLHLTSIDLDKINSGWLVWPVIIHLFSFCGNILYNGCGCWAWHRCGTFCKCAHTGLPTLRFANFWKVCESWYINPPLCAFLTVVTGGVSNVCEWDSPDGAKPKLDYGVLQSDSPYRAIYKTYKNYFHYTYYYATIWDAPIWAYSSVPRLFNSPFSRKVLFLV